MWQTQKKNQKFSAFGPWRYDTALSNHVIHDVLVLFTFAKVEVILLDTFVSDQSLVLVHLLHIN